MRKAGAFSLIGILLCSQADARKNEPVEAHSAERCKEKISRSGNSSRLQTIANLNAVRSWIKAAKSHGETYSAWHRAKGGIVKCHRPENSDYYSCQATGKPCQSMAGSGKNK